MKLGVDRLVCGTSLQHLSCLPVTVGPHGSHGRTRVYLPKRVKRFRLTGDEKGQTDEPGWGVDMMPASSDGRVETGVDRDAGESAWTAGEE